MIILSNSTGEHPVHLHQITDVLIHNENEKRRQWVMSSKSSGIYEPLLAHHFRFLVLEPGLKEDDIRCNLQTASFDAVQKSQWPSYEALSYAWGDPLSFKEIEISGHPLAVTQNLFVALQYLRHVKDARHLWVDAICINQDDIPERNAQVQMMSHIYRGASRIVAWLGEQNANSDAAFDLIEKWAWSHGPPRNELRSYYAEKLGIYPSQLDEVTLIEAIHQDALAVFAIPASAAELRELVRDMGYPHFDYIKGDSVNCICLHQTFHVLGERKWWGRRWVIQEVMNARDIILVCGHRSLPWDMIGSIEEGLPYELTGTTGMRAAIADALSSVWIIGKARKVTPLYQNIKSGIPLVYNIEKFALNRCTDPRDIVYSLLSISNYDKNSLPIDYNKPLAEVFADATRSMIIQSRDISCLGYAPRMTADAMEAPSWIRDWGSIPSSSTLYSARDALTGGSVKLYSAAGNSVVGDYFHQHPDPRTLSLRGVFLDTIASATAILNEEDADINATLRSWEPTLLTSPTYITGESQFDAFWRTLQKDICHFGCERPIRDHAYTAYSRLRTEDLDVFRRCYEIWAGRRTVNPIDLQAEVAEMSTHLRNPITGFGAVMSRLKGYCFVTTSLGYMGVVHGQARLGDRVFVIEGSAVPFILRDASVTSGDSIAAGFPEDAYNFVGVAYVHGVMDGQIMADINQGSRSMADLLVI